MLLLLLLFLSLLSQNPSSAQCLEPQKSSLLTLFSPLQNLSWNSSTNCCHWDGVICDPSTGQVISLDLTSRWINATINSAALISLPSLQTLNLSLNPFYSPIPAEISLLTSLTHLNLSNSGFSGRLPAELWRLKGLQTLDLSYNYHLSLPSPDFGFLVGNLSGLMELHLDGIDISSPVLDSLGGLVNLSYLHLSSCNLTGEFPVKILQMQNLQDLDLSSNPLLTGTLPEFSENSSLRVLELSATNFSGVLPDSIRNLLSLQRLGLGDCRFSGRIPPSLFSLPYLEVLVLSYNQFNSQLDEFSNPSPLLKYVYLSNNMLQGQIPSSLFKLVGLTALMLSSNNFSSTIDLTVIENLKNLSSLDLSDNRLVIITNSTKVSSFPQLVTLELRSCNLTEFPAFLRNQSRLLILDLSKNKINSQVPNWVWEIGNLSLLYLNLSYNELEGQLQVDLSSSKFTVLDLHSNKLQGSIPFPSPSFSILDYSHNSFTSFFPANISYSISTIFFSLSSNKISGEIPSSMCNMRYLQMLDLSNNSLSGLIPNCLGNMSRLQVLNLAKNSFTGTIPQSFGSECDLRTLNLNGNQLEGGLPKSLANCEKLEVLNLGNNRITDSFPPWLGSLHQLTILILRSNKLYGPIMRQEDRNAFQRLQIIDLSSNGFTGNLPSQCLKRWKAMMVGLDVEQSKLRNQRLGFESWGLNYLYQETIAVTTKGLDLELSKTLTVFTAIDLSNNGFEGIIPEEIGKLKSLYMLNMSHNQFSGPIPSSLGHLHQLESLDLSVNQLSGGIPRELTSLTFLEVLNVSKNNLLGSIPHGTQFSTFSNDSFQDNSGLCGPPLTKKCGETPESKSVNLQSKKQFNWQLILAELGFCLGIGVVFGLVVFWSKGRKWYNKHVDKMFFIVMRWSANMAA